MSCPQRTGIPMQAGRVQELPSGAVGPIGSTIWDPWGISRTSTPVHLHPTDSLLQGWVGEEAAGSRVEEVVWGGGVCQLWLAVRVSMSFTIFGGLPAGTSGPVKADCRLLAPRSPTG